MTQQIYTTPTPFSGTNISIPNSGKGYTSNMVIKGQTYQNLVTNSTTRYAMSMDKNTNIFTHNCNEGVHSGVNFKNEIKPNTVYTLVITFLQLPSSIQEYVLFGKNEFGETKSIPSPKIGVTYKIKATSKDTTPTIFYMSPRPDTIKDQIKFRAILLEGDWTNKEVPSEITGIESVGNKENNKISILSHNKNLVNFNKPSIFNTTGTSDFYECNLNGVGNNITINLDVYNPYLIFKIYDENKKEIDWWTIQNKRTITSTEFYRTRYINFQIYSNNTIPTTISKCLITTNQNLTIDNYELYKEDKKEISLPIEGGLKSLPNGVCDTIEQRDDGVYLVQRIGKIILNGSESWIESSVKSDNIIRFYFMCNDKKTNGSILSDKFRTAKTRGEYDSDNECCYSDGSLAIGILKSKLSELNRDGFITWLQANPVTVYYEFATPIETKLDIDNINLKTFKDLTYVTSDNSIEPVLEFKAPILGYKTINPIQLKTTQDGTEVNVYPYSTPELITFGDNETLADKINNLGNTHIHDNATVTSDGFMSKESYAKLESLTEYTHPSTHAATMITQDSSHRFVTDAEKNNWNAKASTNVATSSTNGLMSNTDKQKLDRISNSFDIVYDANTETIRFRFR